MACRELSNLLPVFFDGELEAHQMRTVALHSAQCDDCGTELRSLERLHEALSYSVSSQVDDLDLSGLWARIEPRLAPRRRTFRQRLQGLTEWWSESGRRIFAPIPALTVAAALAALTLFYFTRAQPAAPPSLPEIAVIDNAATIDSLDTDLKNVTVLDDPNSRTTVLWVSDDRILEDPQ